MENATKALLISAGILIGIIILSIAVYLYGGISSYMSRTQDEIENNAIYKFNTQFLNYQTEGDEELSFQDIVTAANIAYENNFTGGLTEEDYKGDGTSNYVQVDIKGYVNPKSEEEVNALYENFERIVVDTAQMAEWLKYNYSFKYKCNTIEISPTSKRVYKIVFEKI